MFWYVIVFVTVCVGVWVRMWLGTYSEAFVVLKQNKRPFIDDFVLAVAYGVLASIHIQTNISSQPKWLFYIQRNFSWLSL